MFCVEARMDCLQLSYSPCLLQGQGYNMDNVTSHLKKTFSPIEKEVGTLKNSFSTLFVSRYS